MKFSDAKRVLSLVLMLFMIVSMAAPSYAAVLDGTDTAGTYATTKAAGETTYVLAGSDFQPTDANTVTGVSLLNDILNPIWNAGYETMDGFLFMGDYTYNYTVAESTAGKEALQAAVLDKYSDISHEVYVQGNHDDDSLVGNVLSASGAQDAENYGVFVINEKDYMWASSGIVGSTVQTTANNLKAYLNAKRNAGYTKPIFVVSHLPLHYSMRTQIDGDGMHANYIFDVLNEAGNAGLNIIFMFGHNHSNGWDDYLGGAAIYLEKGDYINIAQASQDTYRTEQLAFTYMNAGYVSYYRNVNTGSEIDLTMTVFEITDSEVTVNRFSAGGLHDLKSKGVTNTYKGESGYSPDTTVYESPQTIALNTEITPAGEEVDAPSTEVIGRTYTRVTDLSELVSGGQYLIIENGSTDYFMLPEVTSNENGDRVGYNIESTLVAGYDTIVGEYADKEWTMTGSGTSWVLSTAEGNAYFEYQSSSRAYGRISASDSSTFTIGGSADAYTFETTAGGVTYAFDHSSAGLINGYKTTPDTFFYIYRLTYEGSDTPTVDTTGGSWVEVTAPTTGGSGTDDVTTAGNSWVQITAPVPGTTTGGTTVYNYTWDQNGKNNDTAYLIVNGSSTTVLENNGTSGTTTATITSNNGTTAVASSQNYEWKIDSSNRIYTTIGDTTYYLQAAGSIAGGANLSLTTRANSATEWTITNSNGEYTISASIRTWSGNTTYYLTTSGISTSRGTVRLYYANGTSIVGGTTTPDQNGLYGYVSGSLTYNFSTGTDADTVLAAVKAGIEVRYLEAMSTPGADSTYLVADDSIITWTLDPNYDPNTPGDYAVTISYNGVTLGTAEVVLTGSGTDGVYAKLDGELTYNVKMGTSAEDALAAVKAGIDGYVYESATTPGYGVTGTLLDDSALTWTLDPNYSGAAHGEYAVTISYQGVVLGVAEVVVPSVDVLGYSVEPAEGTVEKGASQVAQTGATIYVQLADGKYYTVPVTVAMLTKADGSAVSTGATGTYENLILTYNGVQIVNNFTLNVVSKEGYDYPQYPEEGAVKVNKTAIYNDETFRQLGVAQVELSVSGVPVKKGADVIVMLDLSSSMADNTVEVDGETMTRLEVLKASLVSMMDQLQDNGADGQPMDIRIAVADFHRYYNDTTSPYYINSDDHLSGGEIRENFSGENLVYTGSKQLNADAFVSVHSLATTAFNGLTSTKGTNYDYAFDAIYQLGEAITTANAAVGAERDLFVIFMSDGAPFQYNYFSEDSATVSWNNWLLGTMEDSMFYADARNDYYNEDGKHWMAEAIKGDPAQTYPVIRKNNASDLNGDNWVSVNGLGATMYSIGFCLKKDNKIEVDAMDTVIRNIASDETLYYRADDAATLKTAFTQIAGKVAYAANNARFEDQLGDAFDLQMTSTVERTVDGAVLSLDFNPKIEVKSYDIITKAEADADANDDITAEDVGTRKGTYTTLEVVMFSDDGSQAYSSQVDADGDGTPGVTLVDGEYAITDTGDNILGTDGLIYAKTFLYNTGDADVTVTVGGTSITVQHESFYWKIGEVQSSELAISYYVYLTDSQQGEREAGSYQTNNFAILYYDNYLGNACKIETVSPNLAWKSANVSYGFYLVNEDGEVVVNDKTGETGSFANKIAITTPVVYEFIELNNAVSVPVIDVMQSEVLPDGYSVYDTSAVYKIVILSYTPDGEATAAPAGWTITKGDGLAETTYVTGYDGVEYSHALEEHSSYDYTHTTVWFAVKWIPSTAPDSVVVDYGLPVDIDVLGNDLKVNAGTLTGIGAVADSPVDLDNHNAHTAAKSSAFTTDPLTLKYGTAEIVTDETAKVTKVRYTPGSMQMESYDEFAYEVQYTAGTETQYYYGKVTVIPASLIYYEETFMHFENSTNTAAAPIGVWANAGAIVEDATQDEDRPGQFSLSGIDHDNVYGYDGINTSCTQYSLGDAKKVTVNSATASTVALAPYAQFTFTGTGFDLISLTDYDSGMIRVSVYAGETVSGTAVKTELVDNYYGYAYGYIYNSNNEPMFTVVNADGTTSLTNTVYDANGNKLTVDDLEFEATTDENTPKMVLTTVYDANGNKLTQAEGLYVDETADDTLYQVPVIKMVMDSYGTYTVQIHVAYLTVADHHADGSYNFWLDSVRIYDPADPTADGYDEVIQEAYKDDNEAYPQYKVIKNEILSAATVDTVTGEKTINGAVFIDGISSTASASDFENPGPNNEAYLAYGQQITFKLQSNSAVKPASLQVGAKLVHGTSASLKVNGADVTGLSSLKTATDMYYPLGTIDWRQNADGSYTSDDIALTNATPDTIISLTNVKITYGAEPVLITASNDQGSTLSTFETGSNARSYRLLNLAAASTEDSAVETELVSFVVDEGTVAFASRIAEKLFAEPSAPEAGVPETLVFVPATFKYSLDTTNFWFTTTETLTVVTSSDVADVKANGSSMTKMMLFNDIFGKYNTIGSKMGIDLASLLVGNYTIWTTSKTLKPGQAGSTYQIVAYNASGFASAPLTAPDAAGNTSSITKEDVSSVFDASRKEMLDIMQKLSEKVFSPGKFDFDFYEKADGKHGMAVKTSEDVEYIVANGEVIDRFITETKIDLSKNGESNTSRVWVKDVDEDEEVEVTAYDGKGTASASKRKDHGRGWDETKDNAAADKDNSSADDSKEKNNNGGSSWNNNKWNNNNGSNKNNGGSQNNGGSKNNKNGK